MDSMFVGFGYVAAAFGLCLLGIGAGVVAWRGARLIVGQKLDAPDIGAPEGDDRHFRKY